MRKSATVTATPDRTDGYLFRVSYKDTLPDGTTRRRFSYFRKRGEADAFARSREKELADHGTRHGNVNADARAAFVRYNAWAAGRPDAPSLSALLEKAIAAFETARPPLTVSQAIDARLDAVDRRKLSARHQQDLKNRLDRFAADFGAKQIADVTLREVESWLNRLDVAPQTWTNYARVIGSVFALAMKRGFLTDSPLARLDRPKVTREAPEILTPSQLRNLLAAAALELRPLLVLQAFCGVRRAESLRLEWRYIHTDEQAPYVELPSCVTKTNRRRVCEIPACAVAWLKPLAGMPADSLSMTDTVYNDRLRDAATAAGIEWTENLLRHSFGTYRMAVSKNAAIVAEEMGNSPAVVRTHYQTNTSPRQAAEWWQVVPPAPPESIPFPLANAS